MYTKFYGLKGKPFETTTDPRFLYLGEKHREAMAHLLYAVQERKGFTVITGEVGTGKTTLARALLSKLNGNAKTVFIFNPALSMIDFFHYICEDLGLKGERRSKGEYLSQLHEFLMKCHAQKKNVVLIVDEAQALNPALLEEIRLLTNLETVESKLLQVILLGQPELDETLNRREFRQLKQRINTRYHLLSLNKNETQEYIKNRLQLAGARRLTLFSPSALKEIYRFSQGIPRLINIVCDNALITGYANEQKMIKKSLIREVIRDLNGTHSRQKRRLVPILTLILFVILICGVFFGLREEIPQYLKELWTRG
jgi:general secretion pathway protein A